MKKIFKLLMVIALIVLINPIVAKANTQDGLFRADYSITVEDKMDGSGFVAGNIVTINNEVNGILFGAGNVVNVSSKSDYMFIAGSSVTLNGTSSKDAFVAGSIIELNNLKLDRDLYVAGQKITVSGTVGRNAFVSGSDVVIDGIINGDLFVDAEEITINSNAIINGKLSYNDDAQIETSKEAKIASKTTYKNKSVNTEVDKDVSITSIIVSKLINTLTSLLNILVVGLLMVLLLPRLFEKLKEIEPNRLLPSFAWGLLILVVTPIAALIALITYVGIATSILSVALYAIFIYISTILSSFTITSLVLKNKVKNPYLLLLIGLSCLYLIKLIPFVGGLVTFALICLGLGLILYAFKRK